MNRRIWLSGFKSLLIGSMLALSVAGHAQGLDNGVWLSIIQDFNELCRDFNSVSGARCDQQSLLPIPTLIGDLAACVKSTLDNTRWHFVSADPPLDETIWLYRLANSCTTPIWVELSFGGEWWGPGAVPALSEFFAFAAVIDKTEFDPAALRVCSSDMGGLDCPSGPPAPNCTYSLMASTTSVPAAGGTGSVSVTTQPGCKWSASSSASWLTFVGNPSGTGTGSFSFTAASNAGGARAATLAAGGASVTISQAGGTGGGTCTYALAPAGNSVAANGGSGSVNVATGVGCTWTATSNVPWITLTGGTSGSGTGQVSYSVTANAGAARSGTITIAGQSFTVSQAAAGGSGGCSYSLSPASNAVPATGGAGTISVGTAAGCTWTATSGVPWITVVSGGTGNASGMVTYSVAANSGAARSGAITVAGQSFTVNQAAAAGPSTALYRYSREFAVPEGPVGVAVDPANGEFVVTTVGNTLQRYDHSGRLLYQIPTQGTNPLGVAIDPASRRVFVANSFGGVHVFDAAGNHLGTMPSAGSDTRTRVGYPVDVGIDSVRGRIYVTTPTTGGPETASVQTFDLQPPYGFLGDLGIFSFTKHLYGVAVDGASGRVLVTDEAGYNVASVWRNQGTYFTNGFFNADSVLMFGKPGAPFSSAVRGAAIDVASGNMLVVDRGAHQVRVFDANGAELGQVGSLGSGPGQFNTPNHVAFDKATGAIAVTDFGNRRVQIFDAPRRTAVEYFHAGFGHYFVTADMDEMDLLDRGVLGGWARTGQSFKVFAPGAGLYDVCRFFTVAFAPKSSHFYTPLAIECSKVKNNPEWQYEKLAFQVDLPLNATGTCSAGMTPLFRLYNNGQTGAPNHRYTTDVATRDLMRSHGFVLEVENSACVPQ